MEELDGPAASAAAVVRAEKPVVTQPATRTLPPATQQQLSGFSTAPTSSSYATAPTLGNRVPRPAKPILDQLDLSGADLPHLGRTTAEQQEALSNMTFEQMEGGPYDGMYVAKDVVAKLTAMSIVNANAKVKTMTDPLRNPDWNGPRFPSRTSVPGANQNGMGAVILLNRDDMIHLLVDCCPAARRKAVDIMFGVARTSSSDATAPTLGKRVPRPAKPMLDLFDVIVDVATKSSSYAAAPTPGKRVPRSVKPILDQLDMSDAFLPHLGRTAAERQEALSSLQILQVEGGQHHGMYVASDAVAKLTGKDPRTTRKKVQTMVANDNSGHYQSRTIVPSGNENVRFTQRFCTASTNCTGGKFFPPVLILFLVLNFCTWY